MKNTLPARVESIDALKGQYIRQVRTQQVFLITDVGREGLTANRVADYGDKLPLEPECTITWRAVRRLYRLMVHVGEIDTKGHH